MLDFRQKTRSAIAWLLSPLLKILSPFKKQPPTLNILQQPDRYVQQIDKIYRKAKTKSLDTVFYTHYKQVALFHFWLKRHQVARALACAVRISTFAFQPGYLREIATPQKTNGKKHGNTKIRKIFTLSLVDKIMTGVIANILTEILEPFYSARCYAYRKGSRPLSVIKDLSQYIQAVRKNDKLTAALKITDIYLIKLDIQGYTDNIRVDQASPIWSSLLQHLQQLAIIPTNFQWDLIQSCIRPVYYNLDKKLECPLRGVPTGTPISAFVYNFFALTVDSCVQDIPGLFYARYGDDMLLAHIDPALALAAQARIQGNLSALGLALNSEKIGHYCFNLSGYSQQPQLWRGTNSFNYLGHCVDARGHYSLSTRQQQIFIRDIYQKIYCLDRATSTQSLEEKGKIICRTLNQALYDKHLSTSYMRTLLKETNHFRLLQHFDHLIAVRIAQTLAKTQGPRAFRIVSYKKIRRDWGLKSLVQIACYKRGNNT